jgi:hypothetical protein
VPRWAGIGLVLLLILGALFLIGRNSEDDEPESAARTSPAETTEQRGETSTLKEIPPAAKPKTVRLTVAPTAAVWVCLENAKGDRLIGGEVIAAGSTRTFRSRRFRITIGNGSVRFRANGKAFQPPQSAAPQGFEFTLNGRKTLSEDQQPTCEA